MRSEPDVATFPSLAPRQLTPMKVTAAETPGTTYLEDATASVTFELEQSVNISAPIAPARIVARRIEARVAADSVGSGSVDLGYDYRFGSAAFSGVLLLGSRSVVGASNQCDGGMAGGVTVGGNVLLVGEPGRSLDVRFYLRRDGGLNVVGYCIEAAKVLYDVRSPVSHGGRHL